ncbi:Hypothetical protein CINCED_3A024587 [Cinara cedri]|uniref:Uncharacterized protein n=1 Tax=Cinara cedri TaxID=506608 RepID=A0A5E4M4Z8_9HEMI|nr:Hypothetical protein CINCED_3A024587 [Cinara cedri]
MDNSNEMDHDGMYDQQLEKRLRESENTYKVFGFTHIILIGSIADIVNSSMRKTFECMYRKTKKYCKTENEVELYRQQLCKLYLNHMQRGLGYIDRLEPKLSKVLTVKMKHPVENIQERLLKLRAKVAERTKRVQSLLMLQNLLKTDTIMAEWIVSKVEHSVHEAEIDLSRIKDDNKVIPTNGFVDSLNSINNSINSLKCD